MGDSRKYPYHTTDGFKDFRRGGGIHDYGILKAWGGGIYDLKSEGMGEFHRWDFWSRKCRVSSWKHRQPKRTICGFGLQRSFGRNILELLVYYLMPNKCKQS